MINYNNLLIKAESLLKLEDNYISMLANASAFIYEEIETLNWVGFYLYDGKVLRVGPFQGKVACSVITPPNGVCGSSFSKQETLVVDDVHLFPGHIACDALSQSEIVIPITSQKYGLLGVFDIDSPILKRFDLHLVNFLKSFSAMLVKYIDNLESL